jgi:NADH dehydrogenase FAD-containing subunit
LTIPEIFALGDLADCQDAEGQQVPNTAQAAFQQADYTAWNIWASLTGRPLLPFRYQHLGEMMTLGTDNATFTGLGIKLDGPPSLPDSTSCLSLSDADFRPQAKSWLELDGATFTGDVIGKLLVERTCNNRK